MSEETSQARGVSMSGLIIALIAGAVAGAAVVYFLTPPSAMPAQEAVEVVGGKGLEELNPEARLRAWSSALATYTYHQIAQVYTVYNWDMRLWHEPGAWGTINVSFTGEMPNGNMYTFDQKVRPQ